MKDSRSAAGREYALKGDAKEERQVRLHIVVRRIPSGWRQCLI
jgi:hypothetical protein